MSEVVIKAAEASDAANVALLLTELNRTVGAMGYPDDVARLPQYADLTAQQAEARLQHAAGVETVLVAYAEGLPAGFTSLRLIPYLDQDTPYAEITQMHVRPQFRRQGVASQLIRAAEDMAVQAGATAVHLITGVDNYDAQAFYREAGYEVACLEFEKYLERRPAHA